MLYRKISKVIEEHLKTNPNKILLIDGARQIGKTFIIRAVGKKLFPNFLEINLFDDSIGSRKFANVSTVDEFYFQLSTIYGEKMEKKEDTLIFLDEIQTYPVLLTLLKFLNQDNRFTFIASGSLLGVTLKMTSSIPMGSIEKRRMYPLDFEEFLYANGYNSFAIKELEKKFLKKESLDQTTHDNLMYLFKRYLITGGLPDAVNAFVETKNVTKIRKVQQETYEYYLSDASKYDEKRSLVIQKIYQMIPSMMENKKKRIIIKDIEDKKGKTALDYTDEFEYLTSAGVALEVKAISNPVFPLLSSGNKNLVKLYLNDVGILTNLLYRLNPNAILDDEKSINLGAVYECVVASELKAHGFDLYYYDNKTKGEVDFLIDDYDHLSVLPIEVKSGKDYTIHHAMNTFLANKDYSVSTGIVLSNEREIKIKGNGIQYYPIYDVMFLKPNQNEDAII